MLRRVAAGVVEDGLGLAVGEGEEGDADGGVVDPEGVGLVDVIEGVGVGVDPSPSPPSPHATVEKRTTTTTPATRTVSRPMAAPSLRELVPA
jgi:hypothetical protein